MSQYWLVDWLFDGGSLYLGMLFAVAVLRLRKNRGLEWQTTVSETTKLYALTLLVYATHEAIEDGLILSAISHLV